MAAQHSTTLGARFSFLEIISEPYRKENSNLWYVKCRCDCGATKDIMCKNIVNKHTVSCGCYNRSMPRKGRVTHGKSKTPVWRAYYSMINRCTNPKNSRYESYGGRGICVCEDWLRGFEFFYADMGDRTEGTSLDRIDVNAGYSPANCRWATDEQQSNNKRCTRVLTHEGRSQSLNQWALEFGISRGALEVRLGLGWSLSDALTIPPERGRNQFGKGVPVEFNGRTMTWPEWAKETGISYYTLKKRIEMGWTLERTLTEPLEIHRRK